MSVDKSKKSSNSIVHVYVIKEFFLGRGGGGGGFSSGNIVLYNFLPLI